MRASTAALVGLSLFQWGCPGIPSITSDALDRPEEEVPTPAISVEPHAIDFGVVDPVDDPALPEWVTVHNGGDAVLEVLEVALDEPAAPFYITALGSSVLYPGQSADFSVTFEPHHSTQVATYLRIASDDPHTPVASVSLQGEGMVSEISVDPLAHDFGEVTLGTSTALEVLVSNEGAKPLVVYEVDFVSSSNELSVAHAPLPWTIPPGKQVPMEVTYAPFDVVPDEARVYIRSNDPDEPLVIATQVGAGLEFEGFSTGWYVYDDGLAWETTSSADHDVGSHGDPDLYWYEPSGAHGLLDSADPEADFKVMRDYVLAGAGAPTAVTGPFDFSESSTLSTYEWATYTYFLCDFYMDVGEDPSRYEISSGQVDDGIQVMVNGEILGVHKLNQGSASWPLDNARPGALNSLIIILVDDSAVQKYVYDLAFYKDGVMVTD